GALVDPGRERLRHVRAACARLGGVDEDVPVWCRTGDQLVLDALGFRIARDGEGGRLVGTAVRAPTAGPVLIELDLPVRGEVGRRGIVGQRVDRGRLPLEGLCNGFARARLVAQDRHARIDQRAGGIVRNFAGEVPVETLDAEQGPVRERTTPILVETHAVHGIQVADAAAIEGRVGHGRFVPVDLQAEAVVEHTDNEAVVGRFAGGRGYDVAEYIGAAACGFEVRRLVVEQAEACAERHAFPDLVRGVQYDAPACRVSGFLAVLDVAGADARVLFALRQRPAGIIDDHRVVRIRVFVAGVVGRGDVLAATEGWHEHAIKEVGLPDERLRFDVVAEL